jgi:hypothetical protein
MDDNLVKEIQMKRQLIDNLRQRMKVALEQNRYLKAMSEEPMDQ